MPNGKAPLQNTPNPPVIPALGLIAKVAGACLLSASALGWVAAHSGPRLGTVVVHVTESDVELSVGPHAMPIGERRQAPLLYELPAGPHTLKMRRQGVILHEEEFEVIPGDEIVLTACIDTPADSPAPRYTAPDPAAGLIVP